MDLVYVVGSNSSWKHNELRYSLRSVCANMPHDRVIISGTLPPWCTGVIHVPGDDNTGDRARNAQTKLLAALESGHVGERFAAMNDDFYILQPWDNDAIRCIGRLSDRAKHIRRTRAPGDSWRKAIEATLAAARDMGQDEPLDCSAHHPVIMERDKAIETLQFSLALPVQLEVASAYVAMHGAAVIKSPNAKPRGWNPKASMPVLSSSPEMERTLFFRRWIYGKFPEPCKYEKATSGH